jgi:hypothetical protein
MDAWKEKAQARVEAMKAEYRARETRELIAEYLTAWLDTRALKAQADEYRISQLYFSTRVCRAVQKDDESYDHSACEGHAHPRLPQPQARASGRRRTPGRSAPGR